MVVIVCDVCRREVAPRSPESYGWFSRGGAVVLVDGSPARLECDGKEVRECCNQCLAKCYARARARVARDIM